MMKRNFRCLLWAAVIASFAACKSQIYLKDMPVDQYVPITNKVETRIKPGDRLSIVVKCKKQELAVPFNAISFRVGETGETSSYESAASNGYLVDDNGYIDFPILGRLQVGGLTMPQTSQYISGLLVEGKHIPDAVVETQITNFTIYSIGAVSSRKLIVPEGHINLLQALAQLGDLQGKAKYKKVRVIREDDGNRMEFDVDVTTKDLYESPAFNLQQNDIVYAEPKGRSKDASSNATVWLSIAAMLTSIASSITYIMVNTR